MIGIHILPKKRQFTRAACHQPFGFFQNSFDRTRKFSAACIRHNAKGAKFITAFLNAQKCGWATRCMLARQEIKFHFFGKIRINNPVAACRINLANQFGKPVIGLRPNNNINPWCAADNFFAFGLCHTSGNGNRNLTPLLIGSAFFELAQSAKFGKHLLRRFFTNMACVQNHHIGTISHIGWRIAKRGQHIGHTVRIINIHLTAVGFDKEFFGQERYVTFQQCKFTSPCTA